MLSQLLKHMNLKYCIDFMLAIHDRNYYSVRHRNKLELDSVGIAIYLTRVFTRG